MPIRTSNKEKKFNKKCCGNCFMAYRTRYDHHTVLKCKEWDNKVVGETETCDKYFPRMVGERDRED